MGKFNFRFVLHTLGFMLIVESLLMMLCSLAAFYYHEECGDVILASCGITIMLGVLLRIFGAVGLKKQVGKRESFLTVTLIWVVLPLMGMLPFLWSGAIPSIHDAFFESMASITTTGSSIIRHVEDVPKSLLLWRSIMQWIGGIGIIAFAMLLLPMMGGNGLTLYNSESTGITRDKFSPKVKQMVHSFWYLYLLLTTLLTLLLWLGPMSLFDAVCHALSTVSTGGASTKAQSVAYWNSAYVEYVISIFMLIGGTNFALLYFVFKGKFCKLLENEEFKWYLVIVLIFTVIITSEIYHLGLATSFEQTFRTALFQVISIITTTGFSTADYTQWGVFIALMLCLLMLFCACAGSTSGGLKIIRVVVLAKNAVNEFKRQVHPHAVLPVRINKTVVPMDAVTKVLAFIFLYLIILVVGMLTLSFFGVNFEESVSASLASLSNVGPALGKLGPSGHYADLHNGAKWVLASLMLIGRLEVFTVLSLLMPAFWRK